MIPLDKGSYRPTWWTRGDDTADELRVSVEDLAKGVRNAPEGAEESMPAVPNKKRARRRHGSKHAAGVAAETAAPEQKKDKSFFSSKRALKNDGKEEICTTNKQKINSSFNPHFSNSQLEKKPLYAALDLGTNNCRLLVAAPTRPGYFRVVDGFSRIVRLGEGLSTSKVLSEQAMDRAISALKVCAEKLVLRPIHAKRLIATEACRSATNGNEFIARVKQETGLELEIVNRETEARLATSGCGTLVERNTEAIVLFDIGGGSSEITLIDLTKKRSPRLADHIVSWVSLPIGVVSLAELFGGEYVGATTFERMKDHTRALLSKFTDRNKLGDLVKSPSFHLLGTSGTITTLAGLHLDLERYDRRRVDGIWLESKDVTRMTEKLLSWDLKRRVASPCIGEDRADLVLAGCAILDAIREVWPSQKLRVADRGVREGILIELMSRDGIWRRNPIRRTQFSARGHKISS